MPLTGYERVDDETLLLRAEAASSIACQSAFTRAFSDRPVPWPSSSGACSRRVRRPAAANHQPWHFACVSSPAPEAADSGSGGSRGARFLRGTGRRALAAGSRKAGTDADGAPSWKPRPGSLQSLPSRRAPMKQGTREELLRQGVCGPRHGFSDPGPPQCWLGYAYPHPQPHEVFEPGAWVLQQRAPLCAAGGGAPRDGATVPRYASPKPLDAIASSSEP